MIMVGKQQEEGKKRPYQDIIGHHIVRDHDPASHCSVITLYGHDIRRHCVLVAALPKEL
jgi:hypothetical protein